MMLSPHFSLAELTVSQAAARAGVSNDPPADVMPALRRTAQGLELIRGLLGVPIIVTSGYRSPVVNRLVGGARVSQHTKGEAADIIAPAFGSPEAVVRKIIEARLDVDQVILEFPGSGGWVHVSFTGSPRRQALLIDHAGTRPFA